MWEEWVGEEKTAELTELLMWELLLQKNEILMAVAEIANS